MTNRLRLAVLVVAADRDGRRHLVRSVDLDSGILSRRRRVADVAMSVRFFPRSFAA